MNPHLFVYGTLMSGSGHPMGAKLAREARLIGPASTQGRLYKIDWYPGLVDAAEPAERVYGELYALADPQTALAWLDAYEGLVPGGLHDDEYIRTERLAQLGDGREVSAWTYVYRGDVRGMNRVADGRWMGRTA